MRIALVPLLALTACHARSADPQANGPGARIEASAIAAGIVTDTARAPLAGAWARESDRLCVVPRARARDTVGIAIDYGDGQVCNARGTVARSGDRLDLTLGPCRIAARFEGDRIVLPPIVPAACDRLCTGRASIAALSVDRQSGSAADAAAMIAPDGAPLCR